MADDLRARIVDAALGLLEREGPKGVGQVRVAREAGLRQGHLTYYFPHKHDLLVAVLERLNDKGRRALEKLLGRAPQETAAGRRRLFFDEARRWMADRRRTRVLLGLLVEAEQDEALGRLLVERERRFRDLVAALLAPDADPLDAELAVAALRGLGIQQLVDKQPAAHLDALVERLERWLAPRARRE